MAALGLNYMGTKRALAPQIAAVISGAKNGPVLDGFSGMCAVGQQVGSTRPIWSNDIQVFASIVAKSLFVSPDHPPRCARIPEIVFDEFEANKHTLERALAGLVDKESRALTGSSIRDLTSATNECRALSTRAYFLAALPGLRAVPRSFPYRLFTYYYAGTYLGLRQCIEVDSLVYGIHQSVGRRAITRGQAAWLFIALGMAIQRIATTTGHFAQYLEVKPDSLGRYARQRRRSVWEEWLDAIPTDGPLGDWEWRKANKVFRGDVLPLLRGLMKSRERPAVVYADPPYTSDHYSRYYHLLETLVRYDYPHVDAKARYRRNRFSTPFSIKSKAKRAFDNLARATARLGAELVVSYPKEGLLSELGVTPFQLMRPYFRTIEVCRRITHSHSTHGASKGPASKCVTEIIYWARP